MRNRLGLVVEDEAEIKSLIESYKSEGKKIGFAPTMGALHDGHMSLISSSKKNKDDITVCSIFVNPTQFDDPKDLKKYPKSFDKDLKLLKKYDCDIVFHPSVKTIYPNGSTNKPNVNLNGLDKALEGEFRPGHFDGVVQVVHRLLDIVKPDNLYMGQKDFQQFTIIQKMINKLSMPVNLIVCPIKREANGLAMSSRNARLSKSQRKHAAVIKKTLNQIKHKMKSHMPRELEQFAMIKLGIVGFKPEYFKIVDGYTLKSISNYKKHKYIVALTAVWAGEIRLIDNMIIKKV